VLRSNFFSPEQVEALVDDYHAADLDAADEAIVAFAEQVVLHADEVTAADIATLRGHGLDDAEIFDIVLAATARTFWSGVTDAIGYEPPEWWLEQTRPLLGERLFQALMVGRPVGQPVESSG